MLRLVIYSEAAGTKTRIPDLTFAYSFCCWSVLLQR